MHTVAIYSRESFARSAILNVKAYRKWKRSSYCHLVSQMPDHVRTTCRISLRWTIFGSRCMRFSFELHCTFVSIDKMSWRRECAETSLSLAHHIRSAAAFRAAAMFSSESLAELQLDDGDVCYRLLARRCAYINNAAY